MTRQLEMCSLYILWCGYPTDVCGSCSNLQDADLPMAVPSPSIADQLPMEVRPMNYVWLTRSHISGTFVIDPTLKVPSPLMRSLAIGGVQWNLRLSSQSIADVEIQLVDGGTQQSQHEIRPRTMLYVESMNDARVKLVCSLAVDLLANESDLYGPGHTRLCSGQKSPIQTSDISYLCCESSHPTGFPRFTEPVNGEACFPTFIRRVVKEYDHIPRHWHRNEGFCWESHGVRWRRRVR